MSTATPPSMPPALRLSQLIMSYWISQAIHAAAELGLPDLLDAPRTSQAVAESLGTHADATDRLMRALVTLGLLTHDADGFTLTEVGSCLRTDSPTSRRSWARLMGGTHVWESWGRLVDCVRTGKKAYGKGLDAEIDVFEAMEADPRGIAIFHQAMADSTSSSAAGIARAIDFTGAKRLVDVGGGYGALLCAVLEANPHLQGAVFDLPHAEEGASQFFAQRGMAQRATYAAGSFFDQPPPKADAYLIKSVIHDWDDERSLRILANVREAMDEKARLLLVEPPAGPPSGNPVGDWFLSFSDLNMLVNTGGRERTQAEYVALLEKAKLRVTAVHETPSFYRVFESVRA